MQKHVCSVMEGVGGGGGIGATLAWCFFGVIMFCFFFWWGEGAYKIFKNAKGARKIFRWRDEGLLYFTCTVFQIAPAPLSHKKKHRFPFITPLQIRLRVVVRMKSLNFSLFPEDKVVQFIRLLLAYLYPPLLRQHFLPFRYTSNMCISLQ